METKNAKITDTMLGIEDHGILSCMLYLSYGDHGGQGFGGYALDTPYKDKNGNHLGRKGTDFGMEFINQILKTLNVEKWERLPGTACRVKAEFNKVHSIGHFLDDKWFTPEEFFNEIKGKLDH